MTSFILIKFFLKNEIIPLKLLWIGSELKDNQKFNTSGNRTQLKFIRKLQKKPPQSLANQKTGPNKLAVLDTRDNLSLCSSIIKPNTCFYEKQSEEKILFHENIKVILSRISFVGN